VASLPINEKLMGKLPKVAYTWTTTPKTNNSRKIITLRNGFVERIYPCGIRKLIEENTVLYPIPHFGIVAGPVHSSGMELIQFLEDMRELLISDGLLRLYAWDCDRHEQHVLVSRCHEKRRNRWEMRIKQGLDFFDVKTE